MDFSSEVVNGFFALGGAVLGAVIAGLFAIFVARKSKENKEIVVSTSYPSRLLVVHDQIASNVEILVSGTKVESVLLSEIYLSNTGNKAVENLSFPVTCQDSVQLMSVEILDQAFDAPRSGSLVTNKSDQEIDVNIDYINPGEEISLRCMVSGEEPKWSVGLRQAELNVVCREQPVASHTDVFGELIFEAFSSIPILSTYLRIVSPVFKKYSDRKKAG